MRSKLAINTSEQRIYVPSRFSWWKDRRSLSPAIESILTIKNLSDPVSPLNSSFVRLRYRRKNARKYSASCFNILQTDARGFSNRGFLFATARNKFYHTHTRVSISRNVVKRANARSHKWAYKEWISDSRRFIIVDEFTAWSLVRASWFIWLGRTLK